MIKTPSRQESSVFLAGWCTPFPGRPKEVGSRDPSFNSLQQAEQLVEDMDRILQLQGPPVQKRVSHTRRDASNLALERARGAKMIGSPLDAGRFVELSIAS